MPVQPYLDVTDPAEMAAYGFPAPGDPKALDPATVLKASALMDAYMNRSLFRTTYVQERHRLAYGRNIARLFYLPVQNLISVEGRPTLGRRSDQRIVSGRAPFYGVVPQLGGVPQWVSVDVSMIDLDPNTGEIWMPTNIAYGIYGEIRATYEAGYDPADIPVQVKTACANICRSSRVRGIPDIASMSVEAISVSYINPASGPSFLSEDTRRLLDAYVARGMG